MSKLIIMQGLPASGKTTMSKSMLEVDGNSIRVNKDELRLMLHGDRSWSNKQEKLTNKIQAAMITEGLSLGKTVIVDDTNLNNRRINSLKTLAGEHKVQILPVNTSFDECVSRDRVREKSVGRDVIERMAIKNGLYPHSRRFVLCDLDGTIADLSHRLKYIKEEPKNYRLFYSNSQVLQDGFIADTFFDVKDYAEKHKAQIVFFSGRSSECRGGTEAWLKKHTSISTPLLFMRNEGDHRPDTVVKSQMYDSIFNNGDVIRVYDDRPSVIRMWREKDLEVIDCGDGKEF